jgi:uncharacterized protein YkwD
MRTPRRTLLPASLLIVVLFCTSIAGPASAGSRAARFREKLMHFVNDERRDRGVAPLREVDGLSDLAREHSIHMARQRRLFHTHDLSKKVRAWKPTRWGENVGVGGSIWRIVRMWEQSPPHLSNMVGAGFRRAGAGVVYTRGAYWATLIVIS